MSLYANIHAKKKRGEKMRKKGAKGAPKAGTFKKIAALWLSLRFGLACFCLQLWLAVP